MVTRLPSRGCPPHLPVPGRSGRQQGGSSGLSCRQHLHPPWAAVNASRTNSMQPSDATWTVWRACLFFHTMIQARWAALLIIFPFQLAYVHSGSRHRSGAASRFWEAHLSPRLTPLQGVSGKKTWVEILAGQWREGVARRFLVPPALKQNHITISVRGAQLWRSCSKRRCFGARCSERGQPLHRVLLPALTNSPVFAPPVWD